MRSKVLITPMHSFYYEIDTRLLEASSKATRHRCYIHQHSIGWHSTARQDGIEIVTTTAISTWPFQKDEPVVAQRIEL
jgi:hypothetical protein